MPDLLIIRKIITAFVMPPGLFFVLILAALAFLYLKRKRAAVIVLLFSLVVVFVLSTHSGEYLLVRTLERDFPPLSEEMLVEMSEDGINTAVVVLSAGAVRDSVGQEIFGERLSEASLQRTLEGWRVYRETGFPVCATGGLVEKDAGEPLAVLMEDTLIELGVPGEDIIVEDEARTTNENAEFSVALLEEQGYERIILVTDAVHMKRSSAAFAEAAEAAVSAGDGDSGVLEVVPHPSGYFYEDKPEILRLFPNSSSLGNNLRALHEWVGLAYYRLR